MPHPSAHTAAGQRAETVAANLAIVRAWAAQARADGAALVLTPELFVAADPETPASTIREQLGAIARSEGIGLVASTPERSGDEAFVGADWWDPSGWLVTHVRKQNPSTLQRARGFTGWDGAPMRVPREIHALPGMPDAVALAFADDAENPAYAYYLREHGVRLLLVLNGTATRTLALEPAAPWNPKHTGVPFPQAGPLPEPLLRPLPRVAAAWRGHGTPTPRTGHGLGS